MTKEEIRVLVLARLRLRPELVVWDIGAGTGSVAVEIARMCPGGKVFAIEKDEEACQLIHRNRERFGVKNLEIVTGEAPQILSTLPAPDRVFVGGSGERTGPILREVKVCLREGGVIVATAVTIETVHAASILLERWGFTVEVVLLNLAVARKEGRKHLFVARNPVYIWSAWRENHGFSG